MPIKLYYFVASPPARAVLTTLKFLDLPYELVEPKDMRSEEFLKLNPQHTIPVIVDDDGFALADSHVINAYLVTKYAKDDKLYPEDLKARATVDHRLYFDCGTLFQCVMTIFRGYFIEKTFTGLTQILVDRFVDAYGSLERYLSSAPYIAGEHVTIADFSVLTTLGNAQLFVPVDKEKYPKLSAYVERGYTNIPSLQELNKSGVESLKNIFKDFNFQIP